mmetsp:Transcript_12219/g.18521  ORF Transcript_12219/g.18521 Transcript_12219/m.18521 type:complete len:138 (+) Transcript_12219:71-484(+)|eukprot:CAMPEP_0206581080 /NCGR_PEP_ID=MMETSP0325_2-20121206/33596_1 /ASSEMBLY_ACC=CAM_ASM_000347 /TAXON_ID=2866 /ORGANISM="Crypthecodinium cohnii, Strain Seligo" /LENGTH=137 /DNA_ID=CAMNT_0054087343 /DNA_START=86 /DNA_END=499 /DNA_ORIENTATION=+
MKASKNNKLLATTARHHIEDEVKPLDVGLRALYKSGAFGLSSEGIWRELDVGVSKGEASQEKQQQKSKSTAKPQDDPSQTGWRGRPLISAEEARNRKLARMHRFRTMQHIAEEVLDCRKKIKGTFQQGSAMPGLALS